MHCKPGVSLDQASVQAMAKAIDLWAIAHEIPQTSWASIGARIIKTRLGVDALTASYGRPERFAITADLCQFVWRDISFKPDAPTGTLFVFPFNGDTLLSFSSRLKRHRA